MQPQQLSRVPVRKVRTFTDESEVIDRLLAMAESLGGVVLVRNVLTRASPHSTFAAQRLLSTGDDLCIGAFATTAGAPWAFELEVERRSLFSEAAPQVERAILPANVGREQHRVERYSQEYGEREC